MSWSSLAADSHRATLRRGRLIVALALGLMLLASYTAIAATQHSGAWSFFAYNDRVTNSSNGKHIEVGGSSNTFHGAIKSNGDFDAGGSNNTFNGIVRYHDDDGDPKTSDNDYNSGNPSQENWTDWPGNLPAFAFPDCANGSLANSGDITLNNASADGVWCNGGKITISDSNVTRTFTLRSNSQIIVSGQNVTLTPHTDGVLFYSTSSESDAIDWAGSNGSGTGLAFAPNGQIKVQGSNGTFCMQYAARTIQVSGSSHTFSECLVPTPTPTATETATATATATETATATATATETATATATATETATATPVDTPTPTPTDAPTATATATDSGPTPAATPTPTGTLPDSLAAPRPGAGPDNSGTTFLLLLIGTAVGGWLLLRPISRRRVEQTVEID